MHFLFMTQDIQDQVNDEIETVIEERDLLRSPSQNYIFGGGGYGYHRKFSAQYKTIEKKYLFTKFTMMLICIPNSNPSIPVASYLPFRHEPGSRIGLRLKMLSKVALVNFNFSNMAVTVLPIFDLYSRDFHIHFI